MSILILGDIHLDHQHNTHKSSIGNSINSKLQDQIDLLNWVLDQAIENNCSRIITTGDVFEHPKPHPSVVNAYISWIMRCKEKGIFVDTIMGNHDMLRTGNEYISALEALNIAKISNSKFYKDIETIKVDSTAITFLPFRDRKSLNLESNAEAISFLEEQLLKEVESIPKKYTKILIGHMAIEGSIPVGNEIDDMTNELFCTKDTLKNFDYVWMGHVHGYQVMNKKPHISHIGSMDISDFGESGHSKYIIIFDTEKQTFFNKKIPVRQLMKISIEIPIDVKDTTQYVLDQIHQVKNLDRSIVKLEITFPSPEMENVDRAEIEKNLYDDGVFNIAGFSESKQINLIKKSETINVISTEMDTPLAIKTYANKFDDLELKSKFIDVSLDIYKEFMADLK